MENLDEKYLIMMRATEQAIGILIAAQQECEELYLTSMDKKQEEES